MHSRRRLRGAAILAAVGLLVAAAPAMAVVPTSVKVTGSSPYYDAACTADDVAYQEAYWGDTNYPGTEVEPSLAVNPTDAMNLVGATQQDRWAYGGSRGDTLTVSHDGGATWAPVTVPGIAACDGGIWPRGTDPWLSFAPNGRLYYVSQSFDDINQQTAFMTAVSTDGGDHWSTPVAVSLRSYGFPHYRYDDKVTLTADPTDGTGRTAYLVWDRFVDSPSWYTDSNWWSRQGWNGGYSSVWMSKTTDGGATWTAPNEIYRPGTNNYTGGPIIQVLPNHTLVMGVATWFQNKGGNTWSNYAMFRTSKDGGKTWSTPAKGPRFNDAYAYDPVTVQGIRSGYGLLEYTADPATGTLWLTWEDGGSDYRSRVLVANSTNAGRTWSAPIQVSAAGTQSFTPMIAVAGTAVGVTFTSFRGATDETSQWVATCTSACGAASSWTEAQIGGATEAGEFPMTSAPYARGLFLGDYAGFVGSSEGFHALYALPTQWPSDFGVVGTDLWYSFVALP